LGEFNINNKGVILKMKLVTEEIREDKWKKQKEKKENEKRK